MSQDGVVVFFLLFRRHRRVVLSHSQQMGLEFLTYPLEVPVHRVDALQCPDRQVDNYTNPLYIVESQETRGRVALDIVLSLLTALR